MRKRVRFSIAGSILVVVVVGLVGWSGLVWLDLCRYEVRMDTSWTRLDNDFRHRLHLARDLNAMVLPRDSIGAEQADRIREVIAGLERLSTETVLPGGEDRYSTYLDLQLRLSDILAELTGSVRGAGDREVDRLCEKLTDLDGRIRENLLHFERSMGEFIRATSGFPGSLVARLVRMKQPVDPAGSDRPILAR